MNIANLEASVKQTLIKHTFKAKEVNDRNPQSDVSSSWSVSTQASTSRCEKPKISSQDPKCSLLNPLQRASQYLNNLQSILHERRGPRTPPFQSTPEAISRSLAIDADLAASTPSPQYEPTLLILGPSTATHEFTSSLQRSPYCISAPPSTSAYSADCPRRPKWVQLTDIHSDDKMANRFHFHVYKPGGRDREHKLSRMRRFADVTAVLSVADISFYDDTSVFDESVNWVTELIVYWDAEVNATAFDLGIPFILCFFGVADFRRKLRTKPLEKYFYAFGGGDECGAVGFMVARFRAVERVPRKVYTIMIEDGNDSIEVGEQLMSIMKKIIAGGVG